MATEIAMNEAGRTLSHPFRDLRSAARAKQRARARLEKYNHFKLISPADVPLRKKPKTRAPLAEAKPCKLPQQHYLPLCRNEHCPTYNTPDDCWFPNFPADLSDAPISTFTPRSAYLEANRFRPSHCSCCRPLKHSRRLHKKREINEELTSREWWDDLEWLDYVEQELSIMDGFDQYYEFGENAEAIESTEDWTETGETFTVWCQRRLREMREVNEARIKSRQAQYQQSEFLTSGSTTEEDEDEGYSSDTLRSTSPLTTIPTPTLSRADQSAHASIKTILTPNKWARLRGIKYPPIHGYYWFGEYQWWWHRNFSGCWYVTPWGNGVGDCDENVGCYCKQYQDEEYWEPDGPQWCSLVEWTRGRLRDMLVEEELQYEQDDEHEGNNIGADWEMMSHAGSESWTEVDDFDSEFEEL